MSNKFHQISFKEISSDFQDMFIDDVPSLDMKYLGLCHEKGRANRYKWGCPKIHMSKGQWICDCKSPCSNAKKAEPHIPMKT